MSFSGMLRRSAHLRTDVSQERIASIIRVTRIGELGKTSAVTNNRCTLHKLRHNSVANDVQDIIQVAFSDLTPYLAEMTVDD
jgi:hypothetical protein